MGWLWSTTASPSPLEKDASIPKAPPSEPTPPTPSASTPLSRDEAADAELQVFLRELEADVQPSSKKYNRVPRPPPSSTFSNSSNSTEPLSSQLLPTTMSCRTAFDAAFYCNSFGGRFNDLYRYGNLRSCSETWNDFWFCMKTRTYGEEAKARAVKEFYAEKEGRKYGEGKRSSEDVWKSREGKVEVGSEMRGDAGRLFEEGDEEWRRRERERRKGGFLESLG